PNYGMIHAGGTFIFVKLVKAEAPLYALSRMFGIRNPGNDLYTVLKIMKRLSQLVISPTES
ncbi:restriction endonuclease subunit R, partial [Candidatus Gracilibacteria bacterium]|nr:restriction endonuclease subunit R [Candidatus Gracilibacteria bacterium]